VSDHRRLMPETGYLIAFIAATHLYLVCASPQQDTILQQCAIPGWNFLPKVQQRSWQAIMNCRPYSDPS